MGDETMQTNIVKWGNSQGVRLPKMLLDSVNMSDNDPIELVADGDKIIIQKSAKRANTIQELFAGYEGTYEPHEIDWGKLMGKEVW